MDVRTFGMATQSMGALRHGPKVQFSWHLKTDARDGDSVALTSATQPSIEEIAMGALPGLPKAAVRWSLIDFECGPECGCRVGSASGGCRVGSASGVGEWGVRVGGASGVGEWGVPSVAPGGADFVSSWFHEADGGDPEPVVPAVEGSIPNEAVKQEGYWRGFGNNPDTGQPMTSSERLDRLAPKALAALAVGTCATYWGTHAMAGNPTRATGVSDSFDWRWRSKTGIPHETAKSPRVRSRAPAPLGSAGLPDHRSPCRRWCLSASPVGTGCGGLGAALRGPH